MSTVRLQKYLAETGLGSRRACEVIILAGRVAVNGTISRQLGTKIHPDHDRISVDGKVLRRKTKLYIAFNKPAGVLCSRRSHPSSRMSRIYDLIPAEWSHLFTVGRLDADSDGLIILTNDGEFANHVAHPRYEARKIYRVTVAGRVPRVLLPRLKQGIIDQGQHLKATEAHILAQSAQSSVLELVLLEGKNREIRRLLQAFSLRIQRLQRLQIGPIRLGRLREGKWRTLTESEINSLLPSL